MKKLNIAKPSYSNHNNHILGGAVGYKELQCDTNQAKKKRHPNMSLFSIKRVARQGFSQSFSSLRVDTAYPNQTKNAQLHPPAKPKPSAPASREEYHRRVLLHLYRCLSSKSSFTNYQPTGSQTSNLTPFDRVLVPQPLEVIFGRIRDYKLLPDECIAVALAYARRYLRASGALWTSDNFRALFLVSLMISSKYWLDDSFNLLTFARLADVPVRILSHLERHFLFVVDYRLSITDDEILQTQELILSQGTLVISLASSPKETNWEMHIGNLSVHAK